MARISASPVPVIETILRLNLNNLLDEAGYHFQMGKDDLRAHPELKNQPDGDYYQSQWDETGVKVKDRNWFMKRGTVFNTTPRIKMPLKRIWSFYGPDAKPWNYYGINWRALEKRAYEYSPYGSVFKFSHDISPA